MSLSFINKLVISLWCLWCLWCFEQLGPDWELSLLWVLFITWKKDKEIERMCDSMNYGSITPQYYDQNLNEED